MNSRLSSLVFAILSVVVLNSTAELAPVNITVDGKSEWRVYVPSSAGPVEQFARDELTRYLETISGAKLAPVQKLAKGPLIQIGLHKDLTPVDGLPRPKKGFDGYSLHIAPTQIVIAGDNALGVVYGVYDLLERLGCRWFQPTLDPKDPEVVPRNRNLSLPSGAFSEAAAVELRIYNGSAFFFDLKPERMLPQLDWAAKNRYNGVSWQAHHKPGSVGEEIALMQTSGVLDALDKRGLFLHGPCHSFPYFLPTEKYFAEHPEWFGLYKGERRKHGGEIPVLNYCWSNPAANEEFIRNIEIFLKKYPQLKIFCPVWIDGGGVCECEPCKKRGAPGLIVDLFNLLSDRLEKSCPAVTLECVVGYGPVDKLPPDAKPNGKWQAIYAHWGRNHAQSYGDPNYERKPVMEKWFSAFPRFEICSYYAAASHQPFNSPPFLKALEGDTEYIVTNKITGTYALQYPHGFWWNYGFNLAQAGRYPYYYPNRRPTEELVDYATNYFGAEAGSILVGYFQMMSNDLEISYRPSRGEGRNGDVQELKRAAEFVNRAVEAAGNDKTYSRRAKKLQACHRVLMRWAQGVSFRERAKARFEQMQKGTATREDVIKDIEAGRVYAKNLLAYAAQIEKANPGTIEAEWLESWYLNRVLLGPLTELEKKITSGEQPAK
jgi:hypothetical protein